MGVAPQLGLELIAGHDSAGALEQEDEQSEGLLETLDQVSRFTQLARGWIGFEGGESNRTVHEGAWVFGVPVIIPTVR